MTTQTDLSSLSDAELNREAAEVWVEINDPEYTSVKIKVEGRKTVITGYTENGSFRLRRLRCSYHPADALELLEGVVGRRWKSRPTKMPEEHPEVIIGYTVIPLIEVPKNEDGGIPAIHGSHESWPYAATIAAIKAWEAESNASS